MFFLCCINRWGLQMCTWVKWPVCLPHSITVSFSNISLNFCLDNNKNLLRISFQLNLQSRKIFLGSPLVWVTPQTEPGDLLVFWRSSLHWMIVRWTQSPNSNSRCMFLLNPVNLNFFQMDVVDPVEVGLEDIGGPAAAPSQGVATVAFSHNQVENWGRLMRFPV